MSRPKTLGEVDAMREVAATFADRSRKPEFDPVYYRIRLRQIELEIEAAIIDRLRHPPCPVCPGGVMPPHTLGTRLCVDCGALAIKGFAPAFPDPILDLGDEGDRAPAAEELPTDRGEP